MLLQIIVVLIICGLAWWLIQQLPIAEPFMTIIRVVIILAVLVWLLSFLGVIGGGHNWLW